MQIKKNRILAIVIAVILISSMAISFNALSTVKAANTYPIPGHPSFTVNSQRIT